MLAGVARRTDFEQVGSTSDIAFERLRDGTGEHLDVFTARTQSAGRGTRGRPWASPPGGVYLSAILRSAEAPPSGLWTIAGALAAHDVTIEAGVEAWLEWPNDLVTKSGAKLAGVLAESRGLRPGGPADYVLGFGLNVASTVEELAVVESAVASGTGRPATSLRAEGSTFDAETATRLAIAALERRAVEAMADAPGLFLAFFERCRVAQTRVRVVSGSKALVGRFVALHPDDGLSLALDDGVRVNLPVAHVRSVDGIDDAEAD